MEFDGIVRNMFVQLPMDFNQDTSYPVVFFFHGYGGNKYFGREVIGPLVDEEDFVGIYPQGIENSWNAGSGAVPSTANDVGWTLHILDWLGTEITIDENRIYSLGYSNGGAFSYRLALDTDVFAAVASLSASFFQGRTVASDVQPLSVLQIHGENDQKVPYHGGQSSALSIVFESAMNTVTQWAVHNGLDAAPIVNTQLDSMTIYTFSANGNPHEVRLYCMHGTTHHIITHPFISTNECYRKIWRFFNAHPKEY
ncbi:MAG: hypothetical protein JSU77_05065 [Fidelibacterota bacterium]|nr:MAG: hypothetical protein JSU77_05065 [Candidatus Neomarinimicrobiota bacterium]